MEIIELKEQFHDKKQPHQPLDLSYPIVPWSPTPNTSWKSFV